MIGRQEVPGAQAVRHAEEQTADDGAGDAAEATDDAGGEGLQGDGAAHPRADEDDGADQDARDAAEHGAVGERQRDHDADRDAQEARHRHILGRGLHLLAEQRVFEEQVLQRDQHDGHDEDGQVLVRDEDAAEVQAAVAERRRQGLRRGARDRQDPVLQQDGRADRADDDRQEGAIAQGIVHAQLEENAEDGHHDDGCGAGHEKGQVPLHGQQNHRIGADHGKVALGEVDDVDRAVDHHEAQGDERVDGAQTQARDHKLNKIGQIRHR